ncbi:AMIN-like domain-containing (lipo)protein [Actinophytocola glycyrrhizae]|uniref:AMIN-like domain-containing protein n=1 Tax=Actinophytocola glycyrrhizae TaxID=2044873 RepID=A0ABV9SJ67_9PSEU
MLRKSGLLVSLLAILFALVPVTTASAAPYCGITWGSFAKSVNPTRTGELVDVRAGRHDCYDRLVFDANGPANGYWVSYVDQVREQATGRVLPLRGGAKLSVTVQAPSYDQNGTRTYRYANRRELVDATGFRTFRQVAHAGSFEGSTTVGLGVRARLPFRVFTLPNRIVVDVAHFW